MKAFLDFIPLIAFFIGAWKFDIITASGALLVATVIVHGIHFVLQKGKLEKQQWTVLLLTIVFCGATVLLKDDSFVKAKSPIINSVFAIALIISVFINKPIIKTMLGEVFALTDTGWKKLTLAWAGFFILQATIFYVTGFELERFTDEKTAYQIWYNFKTWGWIPLMVIFMIAQFAILKNHLNPEMLEQAKDKAEK